MEPVRYAIMERVSTIINCPKQELEKPGKNRTRVRARSLLCYWAVRELGLSQTELARRLHLSPEGISLSVKRGEHLAQEAGLTVVEPSAKLEN